MSPETIESVKSVSPEPLEVETRKVVFIMCEIKPREDSCDLMVSRTVKQNVYKTNKKATWMHYYKTSISSIADANNIANG